MHAIHQSKLIPPSSGYPLALVYKRVHQYAIAATLLAASAVFVSQGMPAEHIAGNVAEMLALALLAVAGSYMISKLFTR
jgi:hypothetical protein